MNEPLVRTRGGVHAAIRHDSAVGHVTGAARYLDDVPTEPSTLEAALVLSPHPHARICRIDLSPALAAPGVVTAITAADIPGKNDIAPIRSDEPALAAGIVEYEFRRRQLLLMRPDRPVLVVQVQFRHHVDQFQVALPVGVDGADVAGGEIPGVERVDVVARGLVEMVGERPQRVVRRHGTQTLRIRRH